MRYEVPTGAPELEEGPGKVIPNVNLPPTSVKIVFGRSSHA
jgi:hypothetical protein